MGRATSSLRSGTSHAKRSVRPHRCLPSVDLVYPALFPCCASPFPLRLRGLRQPYDELHSVPSIVRLPPSATAHHSLRITTPQLRPSVARYANSAVRSRHPSGGERSVRTSLHAIRRRCSVLEPAQLARYASPARKLAPKRKSCSGTPCPDAILRKLRNATRHSIPTHLSHPAMNRTTPSCFGRRTVHCPDKVRSAPRRVLSAGTAPSLRSVTDACGSHAAFRSAYSHSVPVTVRASLRGTNSAKHSVPMEFAPLTSTLPLVAPTVRATLIDEDDVLGNANTAPIPRPAGEPCGSESGPAQRRIMGPLCGR